MNAHIPTGLVALSGGCLALLVGTFVGAALDRTHALERGFAWALVPSVAAGGVMAYLYETQPRVAARIFRATTGAVLPVH